MALLRPLLPALAVLLASAAAQAAPVTLINDTFNTENGGAGAASYSGFANFTAADVDLLAPGYFFSLCQAAGGSTPCVDMEGNGNGQLTSRAAFSVLPGSGSVQFDLAGSQRSGANNTVTVSVVSILGQTLFSEVFALQPNDPFRTITRDFAIAAPGDVRLDFLSGGPADSYGLLLDNVIFTADGSIPGPGPGPGPGPVPIPEPASLLIFSLGLASLAGARRRGQTSPDTAPAGS
jgi:hypothetical protein